MTERTYAHSRLAKSFTIAAAVLALGGAGAAASAVSLVNAATPSLVKAPAKGSVTLNKYAYDAKNTDKTLSTDGEKITDKGATKKVLWTSEYTKNYGTVEFTAYNVTDKADMTKKQIDKMTGDEIVALTKGVKGITKTVDKDGHARFDDLDEYKDGKRQVWAFVETKSSSSMVATKADPSIVVLPMTNTKGDGFIKDIQLAPKNEIRKLKLHVKKNGQDGKALAGAQFQMYTGRPENVGTTAVQPTKVGKPLTVDKNGNITVDEILPGTYFFVELNSKVADDGLAQTDKKAQTPEYMTSAFAQLDGNNQTLIAISNDGTVKMEKAGVPGFNSIITAMNLGDPKNPVTDLSMSIIDYKKPTIEKKVADTKALDVGGMATFHASVNLPQDIATYSKFSFTDTANKNLTLVPRNLGLKFTNAAGEEVKLVAGTDYELKTNENGTFTLDFMPGGKVSPTIAKLAQAEKGKATQTKLSFEYKEAINKNAVADAKATDMPTIKNTLKLEFDNGGGVDTKKIPTVVDHVDFKSYGAKFIKESSDLFGMQKEALKGAQFRVYKVAPDGHKAYYDGLKDRTGDSVEDVVWNDDEASATNGIITSGEDGQFQISGLATGTYYLEEIKAPDGYSLMDEDKEFTITETSFAENVKTPIEILDDKRGDMPLTGGETILLVLASGVVFGGIYAGVTIANKKREQAN